MLNLLSFIFGIVSLVIVIGVVLGQLSSSNAGRNFCIVVMLIAVVRLSLGGGII